MFGWPPIVATLLADAVRSLLVSATAARVRRAQRAVLVFWLVDVKTVEELVGSICLAFRRPRARVEAVVRLLRPLEALVKDSRLMIFNRLRAFLAYDETVLPMAIHWLAMWNRPLRIRSMVAMVQRRIIGDGVMDRGWKDRVWCFFELDRSMKNRWDGVVARIATLECGRELACGSEGRDGRGWVCYCTSGPEGVN